MAPINEKKHQNKSKRGHHLPSTKTFILHKVHCDRLSRILAANGEMEKAVAELDAAMNSYWREANQAKELFPSKINNASQQSIRLSKIQLHNAGKELLPGLLYSSREKDLEKSLEKPLERRSRKKPRKLSAKAAYIKSLNLRLSRVHRAKDRISKRILALQLNLNEMSVQDLRDEQTVPHSAACLDVEPEQGLAKLNISISCGFWGSTPAFSPSKVYTFSLDKFSTPSQLQKALFNTTSIHKGGMQVGIDTNNSSITIVGYEVIFPKGYRYNSIKNIDPITYVSPKTRVLINTSCALGEFFIQARTYASDVFGNVSIPIIARIGMQSPDLIHGDSFIKQFDTTWRSEEEKAAAAEEKGLLLEKQQLADASQRALVRKKMEAIQAGAERAVRESKALKEENNIDKDINTNTLIDARAQVAKSKLKPEPAEILLDLGFDASKKEKDAVQSNAEDLIKLESGPEASEEG